MIQTDGEIKKVYAFSYTGLLHQNIREMKRCKVKENEWSFILICGAHRHEELKIS
jgi:hypothetical protein